MAVASGRYRHPSGYSEGFVKLIDSMLIVDSEMRPNIEDVIELIRNVSR